MFKDDDDDEENSFGVTRYACMPSLVALQQMRNRLHLAHLGRKLMKWTAMATGRELRKIAMELDEGAKNLSEEMRNAFIMLARARYFCPDLNKMVTENIGHHASVTVVPKTVTVSAVKIMQFDIVESGVQPYEHLGLEKGGQAILETKKEWLELLKKLILMMQLRTSFIMVDAANKNATKRLNVVKKIVIPRTSATATYILSELEELAREEFSRLKKVKEKKRGKKKHDHVEGHFCPICNKRSDKANVCIEEETYSGYILEAKQTEPVTETVKHSLPPPPAPQQSSYGPVPPPASITQSSEDVATRLSYVKKRLTDIIAITKSFVEAGIDSFDVNEFLNICEGAKIKIENFFETEQSSSQINSDLKGQLENLKCNIRDVVGVTKDFKKEGFVSSSIEKFIKACEIVDSKLNQEQPKPGKEKSKSQINDLTAHIDDVIQMTQDYTSEGLLTQDVEEFLRSCSIIKAKIEGKPISSIGTKDIDEDKLDHLKEHVSELEQLTVGIKEKNITSASVEKFISVCKEFKTKIEQDREKLQAKKAIHELSGHIDGTVGAGKEAQKEGLLGESVEDILKSIGDSKKRFIPEGHTENAENNKEPTTLDALKSQINNIIKSVTKIKSGNLMSVSVDNLLKSCEMAKAKIDVYQKFPPVDLEKRMIYPNCSETCVCEREHSTTGECEKCQNMVNNVSYSGTSPAPCKSCEETVRQEILSEEAVCGVCSRPYEEDILLPELTPNLSPEESDICEVCEMLKKEKEAESEPEEQMTPTVDSSLGYFEKKVRKITRVKRSQNPDGTIREEKETITVRKEKHDPNETSLLDDDENEEYDVSYDSLEDDDEKQVAVCLTPKQNQGFLFLNNKAKSETVFRVSPMVTPILKHCISYDCCYIKDNSVVKDLFSNDLDFCSLYSNSRNILFN